MQNPSLIHETVVSCIKKTFLSIQVKRKVQLYHEISLFSKYLVEIKFARLLLFCVLILSFLLSTNDFHAKWLIYRTDLAKFEFRLH